MAKFKPMELIDKMHGKFSGESEYYAAEKSKKWFPTENACSEFPNKHFFSFICVHPRRYCYY